MALSVLTRRLLAQPAERGALIEQLELQLADLEETAAEAEAAAEIAAAPKGKGTDGKMR